MGHAAATRHLSHGYTVKRQQFEAKLPSYFARARDDGLAALLGNLSQTAFGEPVYISIKAKTAHLLYFVFKNHPFVDGNKRSGAYLFVGFLHRNGRLLDANDRLVINDIDLTVLAASMKNRSAHEYIVNNSFLSMPWHAMVSTHDDQDTRTRYEQPNKKKYR